MLSKTHGTNNDRLISNALRQLQFDNLSYRRLRKSEHANKQRFQTDPHAQLRIPNHVPQQIGFAQHKILF